MIQKKYYTHLIAKSFRTPIIRAIQDLSFMTLQLDLSGQHPPDRDWHLPKSSLHRKFHSHRNPSWMIFWNGFGPRDTRGQARSPKWLFWLIKFGTPLSCHTFSKTREQFQQNVRIGILVCAVSQRSNNFWFFDKNESLPKEDGGYFQNFATL